jgi:hypothetical protein
MAKEVKFTVKPEGDKWLIESNDGRYKTLQDSRDLAIDEAKRVAQVEANMRVAPEGVKVGEPGFVNEEVRVDKVILEVAPEGGGNVETIEFSRQEQAQLDKAAEDATKEIVDESERAEAERLESERIAQDRVGGQKGAGK